jgi:hypothetical protein
MTKTFNFFSNAVSAMIVTGPKLKDRKRIIEKLVRLSEVQDSFAQLFQLILTPS